MSFIAGAVITCHTTDLDILRRMTIPLSLTIDNSGAESQHKRHCQDHSVCGRISREKERASRALAEPQR